jgi:hypothetical protein
LTIYGISDFFINHACHFFDDVFISRSKIKIKIVIIW